MQNQIWGLGVGRRRHHHKQKTKFAVYYYSIVKTSSKVGEQVPASHLGHGYFLVVFCL